MRPAAGLQLRRAEPPTRGRRRYSGARQVGAIRADASGGAGISRVRRAMRSDTDDPRSRSGPPALACALCFAPRAFGPYKCERPGTPWELLAFIPLVVTQFGAWPKLSFSKDGRLFQEVPTYSEACGVFRHRSSSPWKYTSEHRHPSRGQGLRGIEAQASLAAPWRGFV